MKISKHHLTLVKMASQKVTHIGKDVEKREPLHTVGGSVDQCSIMENNMEITKKLKIELTYDPAIPLMGI
jgi:hypothetical protein